MNKNTTKRRMRKNPMRYMIIAASLVASAVLAITFNPPGDPGNPINIVAFPQRDFVSASGYTADDRVVVRVIHDPTIYPGAAVATTDDGTLEGDGTSLSWISPVDPPDPGNPADPALGIVEVNHPGGACWFGHTPDIRPGDRIQIEIMANAADGTRVGRIDETVVQNVTAKRPVQTGPGTVEIHGTAQTSFSGVAPTGQLPINVLEQRLISPGNLFEINNRRALRADSAGAGDGTLAYDPNGPENPNGINWTATYTGLSAADVERALAAESRGMWLGNAILPAGEITTYETGAGIAGGPQAPCSAPLEVLPPPDGVDDLPPDQPQNLTSALISPNSVRLNWSASTDNITSGDLNDNPGVTSYGIYRAAGDSGIFVPIANVQNPDGLAPAPITYDDKNIPPGTYRYKVDAADSIGNRSLLSIQSDPSITTDARPDPDPAGINEPPANGHALLAFPSRDFVSAEGFGDVEQVTIEIIRNGVIVSDAAGLTPDAEGIVEVNHPGGFCWDGVTPEIRAGDILRATSYVGGDVVAVDQIHVANVTAKKAVNTTPGVLPATIKVTGTAQDSNGLPIPIEQLEQRLVGASRDPFNLNDRRALRADSGGAGDGTLVYDVANNPTGIKWTATYVLQTQHDVDLALEVESRILSLGRDPLLGNELTLFEIGLADPPGPSTGFCSAVIEAPDTVPPTSPSNFKAQGSGDRQLTFSWDGSTDVWGVAGYKIFDNGVEVAIAGPTATSFVLTGVAPGNHIYTLRAFDNASPLGPGTNPVARLTAGMGNRYGNDSAPAPLLEFNDEDVGGDGSINVTDLIPPSIPTDLIATIDTRNASQPLVNLSWTGSTDNVGVEHYIVKRNDSFSGSPEEFEVNSTSFTDGAAAPFLSIRAYQYTVEAVDTVGNPSGESVALIVDLNAPNDNAAPSVPTGVAAVVGPDPIHGNNVALSWTPAVDGDLVAHKIYRANHTAAKALIAIVRGDVVTFNDNNLPPGTYHYTVTGIDLHGNESADSAPPASVVIAHDVPVAGHSLVGFPARDFISASGYNLVPQGNFHFELIRGVRTFVSDAIQNAAGDITGTIEVNHPGGACWNTTTPDMRPGDVIRIVNDDTGIAEQTVVSNVTTELPVALNANTVVIHGTAQDANGQPIPVGQLEHRLVSAGALFEKNESRTLRAAAGSDGTLVYDAPGSTHWTATYTGLSANDMLRALGGTAADNTVFVAAESRAVWLGRAPLAGTELTIFENGPEVEGGPATAAPGGAICPAPAETAVAGASFTPASINFGDHSFNPLLPPTSAQVVTFTNNGDAPLTFRSTYKAGLNPGDFNITATTCPVAPLTLGVGASCTVSVNFDSKALGLRQAYLAFTDNAANTTDQAVALTGRGIDTTDPVISVNPSPVAFGTVIGGAAPSLRTITVTNGGTGLPLNISTVTVAGSNSVDFTKSDDTCTGASLNPTTSCTVILQFYPGARGARTATLAIAHNRALPANATSTSVTLNGTGGNAAVISVNSGRATTFGTVTRNTTKDQTIRLQNTGNAAATGLTVAVSSTPVTIGAVTFNNFYRVQANGCGATLAINATCSVTVRFTAPNAVGNNFNGMLQVTTNNGLPRVATGALQATTR